MIDRILILYKKSTYKHYFLDPSKGVRAFDRKTARYFQSTHVHHYQTLDEVEQVLKGMKLKYHKAARGQKVNFHHYDLIITIGGDGTFLEAARGVKTQMILGVNSDPIWSVGRFCGADVRTFPKVMRNLSEGRGTLKTLHRLRVDCLQQKRAVNVINDVLICHANPAAMSRYEIFIGGVKEEQRNSGLWVSTAAGSTGAVKSAGGRLLPLTSRRMQYRPRELYMHPGRRYRLTGGVLKAGQGMKVISLMQDGMVYLDGPHERFPFAFGDEVTIKPSPDALKVVGL